MQKLMNADLTDILNLIPVYLPVTAEHIEPDIAKLGRGEYSDYLFLARREKCWLFDLPSVYTPDSYENLAWTYGTVTPHIPVAALFLHVDKTVEGRPWGSVTLLDYAETVQDVAVFSSLPQAQRERHIRLITKRYLRNVRYCTILDVMQYLKRDEQNTA